MEKPKAYVQENSDGNLESTQHAIDMAKRAKASLDSLKGDLDSLFPAKTELETESIELTVQDQDSERGLLSILAENCPALGQAFAANPKLGLYAYGHIFHVLKEQGIDANALPVIAEKPVQLYMENGHVRMNVPNQKGPDGEWLYSSAEFDLFPWGENTEEAEAKEAELKLAQIPTVEETAAKTKALVESYGIEYQRRTEDNLVYTILIDKNGDTFEATHNRWSMPKVKRMENGVDFYEQYRQNVVFRNPELKTLAPEDRQPYFERLDRVDEHTSIKTFLEHFNPSDDELIAKHLE